MTQTSRIESIDLLRGIVIVLMGLDHVRDYFGPTPYRPEDLTQASAALFATRWVTHFCAPVFLFLAGLGAALYLERGGRSRGDAARFLISRGLFLVVLELLVVNTSWLSYWSGYMFVQVIWVIGWSMVALAGLLYLPRWAVLAFALVTVGGHNLLDLLAPETLAALGPVFVLVRGIRWIPLGDGFGLMVIYSLLPWVGVMALGYLFGPLFGRPAAERRKTLLRWGALLTLLFVLLRAVNGYGDPAPWTVSERGPLFTLLSFLNVTKYPASLDFVLMTLGPALLLLPFLENPRGAFSRALLVFGRVPLFFYLVHIPFIHLSAAAFSLARYGYVGPPGSERPWIGWFLQGAQAAPPGYEQNLWLVWGAWISVTVALYWPCRWFAAVKRRNRNPLLSYL